MSGLPSGRTTRMKFRALFRKLGLAGVFAGLFAFLLMGASVQCIPSVPIDAVTVHAMTQGSLVSLDHDHNKGEHGHHSSTSDTCNDGCCGASCHVLAGPQVIAAADFVFTRDSFSVAPDRVASGTLPFSIERPPRA